MLHRLNTPAGRALYGLRKQTVEPVFGIIKNAMRFRQFLLRVAAGEPGLQPQAPAPTGDGMTAIDLLTSVSRASISYAVPIHQSDRLLGRLPFTSARAAASLALYSA
jgi:hypothetical protein